MYLDPARPSGLPEPFGNLASARRRIYPDVVQFTLVERAQVPSRDPATAPCEQRGGEADGPFNRPRRAADIDKDLIGDVHGPTMPALSWPVLRRKPKSQNEASTAPRPANSPRARVPGGK